MSPFLNEKIFIYTPEELTQSIISAIKISHPFFSDNEIHSFMSWSLLKAFKETSGVQPDNYFSSNFFESVYSEFRFAFEQYMFRIVRDIGNKFRENTRYNLVLTHERLYIITY